MSSDDKYHLERGDAESERLYRQHKMMLEASNGKVLDTSIPTKNLKRIADIATGTGIWMEDASRTLPDGSSIEFVGFDISDVGFPHKYSTNIKFSLHDMRQPFPKEYLGTFDIVHIRLVIYGLTAEIAPAVVDNLIGLLKPGGYLNWVETSAAKEDLPKIYPHPRLEAIERMALEFMESQGINLKLPVQIESLMKERMEDVRQTQQWTASFPSMQEEVAVNILLAQRTKLRPALMAQRGAKKEDIEKQLDALQAEGVAILKSGVMPNLPMYITVGRKKA